MTSWGMRVVAAHVRRTRKPRYATEEAGLAFLHSTKGPAAPPGRVLRHCDVTTRRVRGFDVHAVRPRDARPGQDPGTVVYLHGGAYTNEIVAQQWSFVDRLARRVGCEVLVPIYGLAPRHHVHEALDLVGQVVAEAVACGRRCVLAGDSAGAGLALVVAQASPPEVRRCLAGLVLVAPWVDLTMTNPAIEAIEPRDPWLTRAGLWPIAKAWADGVPLDDPRVSPVHGDLRDLPPVDVWVGTRDITLPDCRVLGERMPAGAEFTLHVADGGIHDYPLLPAREGRAASRAIAARVAQLLAATGDPSGPRQ